MLMHKDAMNVNTCHIAVISLILRNVIIVRKKQSYLYNMLYYDKIWYTIIPGVIQIKKLLRNPIEYMHESEKCYRHIFVVIKESPSFFAVRDAQINI